MSIQNLRDERVAKAREYRNILDQNPKGKTLPEDAVAKLDELERDITALEDNIARHEKALAFEAERIAMENVDEAAKAAKPNTPQGVFNKWLKGGDKALTAEDWAVVRNTMSTTTDSEGGYTVPTETAQSIMDALKAFGGMREACTVITTASGNPMEWPTSDGTSEEGEQLGENESATDEDVSFGTKTLPVYKYSSKVIPVPIELLQDSSSPLESFIRGRMVTRLGRITNRKFTVGTGSGEPQGIVGATSLGKAGASGQTATVIYDDLVDLEHSVDPAYRVGSCRFMMNDSTLKALRKLKDGESRPIWQPDISAGAPATILNYQYTINQNMAAMAAEAKSILFGDFSKYVIRDAMALTFYRFTDSAYAKKGQVGFLAFLRSGGNFMDVGGAVKYYQNAAS
jgi:HK97 family phage major capsid protein